MEIRLVKIRGCRTGLLLKNEPISELNTERCPVEDKKTYYKKYQQVANKQHVQKNSVKLKTSIERRVQFFDAKMEYEPCSEYLSGDKILSGESTQEDDPDVELSKVSDTQTLS